MKALSAAARSQTIAELSRRELHCLVIGGGITGAAIVRDAAMRGLQTALVERRDFASGTSSRSSKLIHSGIRYLERGEIAIVREAAAERRVLRHIAPELLSPLLMVFPLRSRAAQAKLGLGLWTFEKIAAIPPEERHSMWSREKALAEEPALEPSGLLGAAAYTEYLADDARLVIATLKSACRAGALCVNYVEARAITVAAGRLVTVVLRDATSGAGFEARARVVVSAAGPWSDQVRRLADPQAPPRLRLAKGIHLTISRDRLPLAHAVVMSAKDRRPVFAIPRGRIVYLGTTDTDAPAPDDDPEVSAADADYLLEAAARTFRGRPLTRSDVLSAWAGLRPLLHEGGKPPSEISRRDEIAPSAPGVLSIAGGKLTTHRSMAERVVDRVVAELRRQGETVHVEPCQTASVPLAAGQERENAVAELRASFPNAHGTVIWRLAEYYGGEAEAILRRAAEEPALAEPLPGLPAVLRAEVDYAVAEEMALSVEDVLERRLRVLPYEPGQGVSAAEVVADMLAQRLGWPPDRAASEAAAYRRLAARRLAFPP